MEKTFAKLLVGVMAVLLLSGCSGYNKLLKSQNHELMYTKALEYFEAGKYQKTIQLLEEVTPIYNGTARADSVAYYQATAYYKMGDFETSGALFNDFRRSYGRSPFVEDAEYMYAKGFYYSSPEANRDQTATKQALIAINEYLERYPNSVKKEVLQDNIRELTEKLHDKVYLNAKLYYTIGRYKSAVVALKNAVDKYPESRHREELLYLIAKSSYLLASNSMEDLQRDRYLNTLDAYYNVIAEYPETKYRKELDKMQLDAKQYLDRFDDLQEGDSAQPGDIQPEGQLQNTSDSAADQNAKAPKSRKEKKQKTKENNNTQSDNGKQEE